MERIEFDRIYHEDCMEGMKRIPPQSIDAIICDLPYGTLNRGNHHAAWDRRLPLGALWEQYLRITKSESPIILFGQGMFTAEMMVSMPRLWRYNLIWYKDRPSGHLNANRMPLRKHEDIMVFYRSLPKYHPQMRPCRKEERNHGRREAEGFTNRCYGQMKATPIRIADDKYPTSVIHIAKEHRTGLFFHPTQKPVALLEYLIRTYTDEGDVVLDSCMGSGTTAVAAIRCRRHFIGFETVKEYCDIACQRIREERISLRDERTNNNT